MGSITDDQEKKSIFIFDFPRSCSNLFGKLFSAHPRIEYIHRPYLLPATRGPEKSTATTSEETKQALAAKWRTRLSPEDLERWSKITWKKTNDDLVEQVESAHSQKKVPFIQEHTACCIRNEFVLQSLRNGPPSPLPKDLTYIPTKLQQSCIPVFLIRHPALAIPSFVRMQRKEDMLRLGDESFQWWISLHWSRMLYDYFSCQDSSASKPTVVDAEDVVHNTTAVTKKLCDVFGISLDGVRETWEQGHERPLPEGTVASFIEDLRTSTGVLRGERKSSDKDIDIDSLYSDWVAEFGENDASVIRRKIEAEMPSYWYLRAQKIL